LEIITLILLANLNIALAIAAGVRLFGKKKKAVAATPTPAKAISNQHRLVKTYISDTDNWIKGWRFLCSCGARGCSSNLVQATAIKSGSMGSEASAIEKFKVHRDNFIGVNGDEQEHEDTAKLRKLEEEFALWRKLCYCKDTNDDLLLLKHRHLDSKPITEVQ
jgi:hypothetical protein